MIHPMIGLARSRGALGLACVLAGVGACSARTRYAQTALAPPPELDASHPTPDAGSVEPVHDAGPPACPASLADRITITHIDLDVAIRYKRAGYDNFPLDDRVAFSVIANGSGYLAWVDNASGAVRVTPLDSNLLRRAPDILVPGLDLGGLAAREDGFALLTRRDDPGEQLIEVAGGGVVRAATLVRYRNDVQLFAAPLTGTASVTHAANPMARDCVPYLYSRLAWNGTKYGAYFIARGCMGDPHEGTWGDKTVYVDDRGGYVRGGSSWACRSNQGLRFAPEPEAFTTLCVSDSLPFPGLDLVVEGVPARQLSAEMVQDNYTAGQFGSVVKMSDGTYVVGWLSRGAVDPSAAKPVAAKQASDMAMLRLGPAPGYSPMGPLKWLLETPTLAETNMHLAPYGADRLLLIWDSVDGLRCDDRSCFGNYAGTHARLIDKAGNFLTPDTRIAVAPNASEDLLVLPNNDVGFAFVPEDARSYAGPITLDRNGVARVPAKRRIDIARLRYCE